MSRSRDGKVYKIAFMAELKPRWEGYQSEFR